MVQSPTVIFPVLLHWKESFWPDSEMLAKLLHSLMLALSYVPKVCLLPSVD